MICPGRAICIRRGDLRTSLSDVMTWDTMPKPSTHWGAAFKAGGTDVAEIDWNTWRWPGLGAGCTADGRETGCLKWQSCCRTFRCRGDRSLHSRGNTCRVSWLKRGEILQVKSKAYKTTVEWYKVHLNLEPYARRQGRLGWIQRL